jgi:hypothetical protein
MSLSSIDPNTHHFPNSTCRMGWYSDAVRVSLLLALALFRIALIQRM